jgi:O-antigen ligase
LNFSKTIKQHNVLDSSEMDGSKFAVIAKVSFVIYLLFIFFVIQSPFKDEITDVEEISTSNVANQIILSILFLTAAITLIPKRREVFTLIKKEKFLTLFLIWCLLSVFWSEFSLVSFKRLFRILVTVSVSLSVLLYTDAREEPLKFFRWILYIYILSSILAIMFVPGARDPQFMTWRGLASTKNHLGQAALVSAIIWFGSLSSVSVSTRGRIIYVTMLALSLVLLFGSKSLTSIATIVFMTIIWLVSVLDNRLQSLGIGRLFAFLSVFVALGIGSIVFLVAPESIAEITAYFGKDITFSGRTALWGDILSEVKQHLLFGCGFNGFWVMDNVNLMVLYQEYVWLPRQAHNGYLDILNETGLVGLAIFFTMVIYYLRQLLTNRKFFIWKWFFIAALIINFQETTLFRPNILTGVMFVFSYLAGYTELSIKNDQPA